MPYMKDFDIMYTDVTFYESEMRYPMDVKFLWDGIENSYVIMCGLSAKLNLRRPMKKYVDVEETSLSYRK